MSEQGKSPINTKNLLIVVIVLLLGIVAYFTVIDKDNNLLKNNEQKPEEQSTDKYQAVFLTNGQVYFGKLEDKGGDYVKLTDIYYLQAQDQVQPKENVEENKNDANLTLIKLGKELHAPSDEMNINREQVLFWENIEKDGKVMKAIEEYKASNK
ncbi:hypothetical protein C4544_00925 [candidate division WS5 bacterium]|uniref:Uncharacterized protein n=1 Tax=candidate division WS5 bacterium TaxID=2093353 RepID=A0A419DG48_9BACT|nr:MAG: hypothetical protein C4544_00925 [candidate division WS5 bacterium]